MNTRSAKVRTLRSATTSSRKRSSATQTRSANRSLASAKGSSKTRRTKAIEANAAKPASRAARIRAAASSSTPRSRSARSTSTQKKSKDVPRTLPSTSRTVSRRHPPTAAMSVAQHQSPSASSGSVSVSASTRKRKAEEAEGAAGGSKRERANIRKDKNEARALLESLKAKDRAFRKRELALQKREAALSKSERALRKKEETYTKKFHALHAESEAEATKFREMQAKIKVLQEGKPDVISMPNPPRNTSVDPQWVLAQLEDQFQCSLCFEIMACPYELNHGRCGHTFCALCVLKWCFAAVHRGCGYWHEPLECPLCRAELPYIPDNTPRLMCTFPFVPCRPADISIKSYIETLRDAVNAKGLCAMASGKVDEKVAAWAENGLAKLDWTGRETRGRAEMTLLVNNWEHVQAEDFIAFKDRLEAL